MISDVLHDAIYDIKRYMREFECYQGDPKFEEKIKKLLRHMRRVMNSLDAPPDLPEEKEADKENAT